MSNGETKRRRRAAAYLAILHLLLRVAHGRIAHLDPRRLRRYVTVLIGRDKHHMSVSAAADIQHRVTNKGVKQRFHISDR